MQLWTHNTVKRWRGVERPRWLRRGTEQDLNESWEKEWVQQVLHQKRGAGKRPNARGLSQARIRNPCLILSLCHKGQDKLPNKETTDELPAQQQPSGPGCPTPVLPPQRRKRKWPRCTLPVWHREVEATSRTVRSLSSATGSLGCGRGAATWHCVPLSGFVPWRGTTLPFGAGALGGLGFVLDKRSPLGGAVSTLRVSSLLRLWPAIWQSSGCHWNQARWRSVSFLLFWFSVFKDLYFAKVLSAFL